MRLRHVRSVAAVAGWTEMEVVDDVNENECGRGGLAMRHARENEWAI